MQTCSHQVTKEWVGGEGHYCTPRITSREKTVMKVLLFRKFPLSTGNTLVDSKLPPRAEQEEHSAAECFPLRVDRQSQAEIMTFGCFRKKKDLGAFNVTP